jgi:uncharacterized damage-inducible protein DinB
MQQTDNAVRRPAQALRVNDLAASRAFYTEQLGFGTTTIQLPETVVEVTDFINVPILLVGPDAGDVTAYLQDQHEFIKPGAVLPFICPDLDAQLSAWATRGLTDVQEGQTPLGDRALIVQDINGYILFFTPLPQHSPEKIIELYAQGPQRLQEALAGITEQDLALANDPGEWSIRQLVHHIADGDDLWMHAVKAALARPGCHYRHDWYTTDNASAELLDYAGRAIEPALLLFQANHEHILQLLRHLPGALDRFILFAWPNQEEQPMAVRDILFGQAMHVAIHCNEIQEIRHLHHP